jgi:hypothetical protein
MNCILTLIVLATMMPSGPQDIFFTKPGRMVYKPVMRPGKVLSIPFTVHNRSKTDTIIGLSLWGPGCGWCPKLVGFYHNGVLVPNMSPPGESWHKLPSTVTLKPGETYDVVAKITLEQLPCPDFTQNKYPTIKFSIVAKDWGDFVDCMHDWRPQVLQIGALIMPDVASIAQQGSQVQASDQALKRLLNGSD